MYVWNTVKLTMYGQLEAEAAVRWLAAKATLWNNAWLKTRDAEELEDEHSTSCWWKMPLAGNKMSLQSTAARSRGEWFVKVLINYQYKWLYVNEPRLHKKLIKSANNKPHHFLLATCACLYLARHDFSQRQSVYKVLISVGKRVQRCSCSLYNAAAKVHRKKATP